MHVTVENIEDAVRHPRKYTINGGKYILTEISNFAAPVSRRRRFDRLRDAGLHPLLVHPERNAVVRVDPGTLSPLINAALLVQVTANAVAGRTVGQTVHAGFVHMVASDAHDCVRRTLRLDEAAAARS
jgi:protein-tyrosine phosphatase